MKIVLQLLILLLPFSLLGQLNNPQSRKVTEKFFPDPDIEIHTPAFQKKKGFTNYKEMMAFLEKLTRKYPDIIHMEFIGESQKGKKIPLVLFEKEPVRIRSGCGCREDCMGMSLAVRKDCSI